VINLNLVKWFIAISVVCLIIGAFVAEPLYHALLSFLPAGIKFIATSPTDGFIILMYLGLGVSIGLLGFTFSAFGVLYLKDALYKKEKNFLLWSLLPASFLFVFGTLFGFLLYTQILMPFFIETNSSMGIENFFNLFSVISNLVVMSVLIGICFELPLVLRGLITLGFIEAKKLRESRGIIFFIIFFVAAVIVPTPDILSSGLVALPLYVLFEVSLIGL
jgi:sec-independent protein translocase protein TatC